MSFGYIYACKWIAEPEQLSHTDKIMVFAAGKSKLNWLRLLIMTSLRVGEWKIAQKALLKTAIKIKTFVFMMSAVGVWW